jgi:hypothetical protein
VVQAVVATEHTRDGTPAVDVDEEEAKVGEVGCVGLGVGVGVGVGGVRVGVGVKARVRAGVGVRVRG